MSNEVTMPRISMTMIEGVIVKWLKQPGDSITEGEPLLEVETDKIVQMMNAPFSGTLLNILAKEGDSVPVDAPICVIGEKDELPGGDLPVEQSQNRVDTSEPYTLKESKSDALKVKILASPLAKSIALKKNIDLKNVAGTGIRGMITKEDVLALTVPGQSGTVQGVLQNTEDSFVPFTGIRRRIADNLMNTKRTMADVTTFAEINLGKVQSLRQNMKVSYTSFMVRSVALALEQFPLINSQIEDDVIRVIKDINVNVAVATEKGLLTPVIRNANKKNLLSIAEEIDILATRGRESTLTADELYGGTFTVTNSGLYGAMFFTPIINSPQCAILGMGKIFKIALLNEADEIVPTTLMIASLTYDHRIVDGETAVKFLQRVKEYMENPMEMMLTNTQRKRNNTR